MPRRRFALLNGLLLATLCITTAWGQNSQPQQQRGSLADRMAALRRGWTQDSKGTNGAEGAAQTVPQSATASTPTPEQNSSAGEKRSLVPGWFVRNGKDSSAQSANRTAANARPTGNNSKRTTGTSQMPPDPATMTETAENPQAGSTPRVASRQSAALPGLGGSPLPRTGSVSGTVSPNATNNATPPTGKVDAGTARKLNVSSPTAATTQPRTASRQSPGRRTAPHIDPNELRRELAGSFPVAVPTESAPPAAQAEPQASVVPEDSTTQQNTLQAETAQSEASSNAPLALPLTEQSPQIAPTTEAATQNAAEAFGAAPESRSNVGSSNFVRTPRSNSLSPAQQNAKRREAFGEALQVAGGGDPSVLVSNQSAVLEADIRGPKQILVGREAVYRIHLANQSDFATEGVVATVSIPSGAEVLSTDATQGMVKQSQEAQAAGQLQWQLARIDKQSSEMLEVRLVPRESKPLELGISWTVAPVGSRTLVEVQEPKLQLEVTGPNEVLFDQPQVFKLTLTNPGTGPAEKVKIDLMPPGGGQDAVTSHPIGDLAPGASQTIEVELTAREAGKMVVKAIAAAEGGLVCDATKEVFCRKPELEVDWRGPTTKYAGTLATYFFRVRNPGTAAAEDVTVQVNLPEGAEFMSASEGQGFDAQQKQVTWHAGTLAPGDDKYMELKCQLTTPGANQFKVSAATASGNLRDDAAGETNVVALADLKLDVTDPSGPVAVGSQVVYEIHVANRGASGAKDINIVGLFSEGIEPDQAEGAMYTVADGRVSFRAIDELSAGRDIVLRIRAHAVQPGNHVFRAEVLCRDLEIKLAAEETTRFYTDDVQEGEQGDQQSASRSEAFNSPVR